MSAVHRLSLLEMSYTFDDKLPENPDRVQEPLRPLKVNPFAQKTQSQGITSGSSPDGMHCGYAHISCAV